VSAAHLRLEASRQRLRRHLLAAPQATAPGKALAADWLSVAAGLGGPPLADSLKRWARAEFTQRLLPPLRRHPLLALAGVATVGMLLMRSRWARPLLAGLASQVLLPRLIGALAHRRPGLASPAPPASAPMPSSPE